MKLYDVKPGSLFRLTEFPVTPPASPPPDLDQSYKFGRIDGMYSCNTGEDGERYYFSAWTEVEVLNE